MGSNFVKWIGGGLGWGFSGPLGGVLGFIVGTVVDSFEINIFRKKDNKVMMGGFTSSLLGVIALMRVFKLYCFKVYSSPRLDIPTYMS